MMCRNGQGGSNYDDTFVLYSDGYLYAKKAEIEGKITSDSAYIGDKNHYLKYENGRLEIKADSITFDTTSTTENLNMLLATYPSFTSSELYEDTVENEWFKDIWHHSYESHWKQIKIIPASDVKQGLKGNLIVANTIMSPQSKWIGQYVTLEKNKTYTLSGYVVGKGYFRIQSSIYKETVNDREQYKIYSQPQAEKIYGSNEEWDGESPSQLSYFVHTFTANITDEFEKCQFVFMNHIGYESAIGWYKLKLEEGDKANSWASSPEDTWALMDLTKDEVKAEVVSKKGGSETGFGWNLDDKSFNLYAIDNRTRYTAFKCDKDGIEVTGRGKIGNWELDGDWLNTNNDGKTVHGGYSGVSIHRPTAFDGRHGTDDIVMICREGSGGSNYTNPFVLYSDGYLYCKNANIEGKIITTEGEIGGISILKNGGLITKNNTLSIDTNGTIKIGDENSFLQLYSKDGLAMLSIGNSAIYSKKIGDLTETIMSFKDVNDLITPCYVRWVPDGTSSNTWVLKGFPVS